MIAEAEVGDSLEFQEFLDEAYDGDVCVVAYIKAYFDDSGTHIGSPATLVGGCLMEKDGAADFSLAWKAVLDKYNLPCFHSSDFNGRHPPFDKLTDREWDEIPKRLLPIVCKYVRQIIVAGFRNSDYEKALADCGLAESINQYSICGLMCISRVKTWAEQNDHKWRIPFTFDRSGGYADRFFKAYMDAKDEGLADKFRLGKLIFEDKEIAAPLQAADLIVYEAYRDAERLRNPNYKSREFLKVLGSKLNALEFFPLEYHPLVNIIKGFEARKAATSQL